MNYTDETIKKILKLKNEGLSGRQTARILGIGKTRVNEIRAQANMSSIVTDEQLKLVLEEAEHTGAKVLLLDIETAPILAAVWGLWKNNVGLDMIERDWFIMSYSAKWLHESAIHYNDCRANIEDDDQLLAELWILLDEADIVVAHNVAFDVPKIRARMVLNGYRPPSPFKTYCTLLAAKKLFNFTSNKLAYLSNLLSDQPKSEHAAFPGFKLWKECLAGNKDAWNEMEDYNRKDVLSLQDVYIKLRAWDNTHPNVAVFDDEEQKACPACGSLQLTQTGYTYTNVGMYQRFLCNACYRYSRSRYTLNSTKKRKSLLT